jgi:hypothetical protein
VLLAGAATLIAALKIEPGSKVFIHPMDGFENFLVAAFQNKKVPLVVVADREKADFEIKGNSESKKPGWAKTIFGSGRSAESASIQMINIKTGEVVYAVSSEKNDAWKGKRSTAEHIAERLGKKIRKGE